MKSKISYVAIAIITLSSMVFADHPETSFPAWTYYGEIVEHLGILAAALIGFIFLLPQRKKRGMDYVLIGLALLSVSQLLVNMHHFLILYAGIFTALVHHGLLLIAVIFLIFGMHKSSVERK